MKKAMFLAMTAIVAVTMMTGCIGGKNGFALTKKIYDWNCSFDQEKWINELVFLGLNIIPVYGVSCVLIDGLVCNSIDFWTGENPIAATSGTDIEGNYYAIVPNADGTATLTYKGETHLLSRSDVAQLIRR